MALAVPFLSLMAVLLSALQGAKLVKYKIIVEQIFMPLSRFVLILIFMWFGSQILGVVWAWTITAVAGFLLAVIFMLRRIGHLYGQTRSVDRKAILSFSTPLFLSRFFYQNRRTISIIILGGFYPADQIGIFGVAMRAIPFLLIPLFAFNAVFSPIISDLFTQGKLEELARVYKTGSKWVISATLPIFILIVFFSKELVTIFGSGFAESAKIMVILLIGQMVNVSTGSSAIMLSMTGKPLYNLFNTLILFVLSIGLTIFMINRFGPIGAAYAYSLSIIIVQLLQKIEVWYLYKIQPYTFDHIKPVICGISSFLVLYFLKGLFASANSFFAIIVLAAIFLLSYVFFLFAAGLSVDDRVIIEKLYHKILRKPVAITK
jgi:O-antigen/teichoic acid export membrane protein